MTEVFPDVITRDLGEAIEDLLGPNVEGNALVAKTKSRALLALIDDAAAQFSANLGLNPKKVIKVLEQYEPKGFRKKSYHVHADLGATYTLGLSSDRHNNAGTISLGRKQSSLHGHYNADLFRLGKDEYSMAVLRGVMKAEGVTLAQAQRFGALVVPELELHVAPHLPDNTARLLLLYNS